MRSPYRHSIVCHLPLHHPAHSRSYETDWSYVGETADLHASLATGAVVPSPLAAAAAVAGGGSYVASSHSSAATRAPV